MNKRLIVCCDSTWQKTDSLYPTNVAKMIQAIPVISENVVFYGEGVGTGDFADHIFGGAFGWGLDKNIQDAYRFLSSNYSAGDQIHLFGFSRGAYTVRSLVGLIRAVGMLPRCGIRQIPEDYQAYQDAKGQFSDQQESDRRNIKLREINKLKEFRQALVEQYGNKLVISTISQPDLPFQSLICQRDRLSMALCAINWQQQDLIQHND